MSRPSLRAAIDAKCKSCIYDPGSGNGAWREQVQACSSSNCPLHPVRPLAVKAEKSANDGRSNGIAVIEPVNAETAACDSKMSRNGPAVDERRAA